MADSIVKCMVFNSPAGALDHYEVTFALDAAAMLVYFSVLPSEMTDPSDLSELKTLACAKASAQKAKLLLVPVENDTLNGPVTI